MSFTPETYDAATASQWLFCVTCGAQYPTADRDTLKTCFICDDPRQYFVTYEGDDRITFIHTVPRLAIGQRAILIRTPAGNILWDCITLLDEETIGRINQLGGIKAMVISHPHFYSSHVQWARAFGCPVYISAEDEKWTTLKSSHRLTLTDIESDEVLPGSGAKAIKLGGHFPGSMVLLFDGRLFIADTLMTTPAGIGNWAENAQFEAREKPPGFNTFAFLWSIPNAIPLGADELARMWGILRGYDFKATHGLFMGMDIEDVRIKERVLESMKIQMRAMGHATHALLAETV
ncbi:hypothetical protein PT974_10867 [Cladobotryum mycophilum]|uniref:Metallo-beta-lactamase domain-containing protein n=1 Tax=Cladobotryum mycophilum TaxID=491253 RepID=A0ABR0SB16_9HYPO